MGVDVAVALLPSEIGPEQIASLPAIARSRATSVYFVFGAPSRLSAGRHPFAVWASGPLDWEKLGCAISKLLGRFCLIWKSDHGGCGGHLIYDNGFVSTARTGYDEWKSSFEDAFRSAFYHPLKFTKDEALGFPESLLSPPQRCTKCERVKKGKFEITECDLDVVRQLFEFETDTECVLPFDFDE